MPISKLFKSKFSYKGEGQRGLTRTKRKSFTKERTVKGKTEQRFFIVHIPRPSSSMMMRDLSLAF